MRLRGCGRAPATTALTLPSPAAAGEGVALNRFETARGSERAPAATEGRGSYCLLPIASCLVALSWFGLDDGGDA
jgi:hypothetical protein